MTTNDIIVITPNDIIISRAFLEIERNLKSSQTQFIFSGLPDPHDRQWSNFDRILGTNARTINRAVTQYSNITITYHAFSAPAPPHNHLLYHAVYGTIRLDINDHSRPSEEQIVESLLVIGEVVNKEFLTPGSLSETSAKDMGFQSAIFSALQIAASEQIARTNEFVRKITDQFDEQRQKLTQEFDARRIALENALDTKSKNADQAIAEKEQKLQQDREALDNQRKALDDRDNTHARRAVRGELISTIQDRQDNFSIASGTTKLRAPIHIIFVTLLIFTAAGAAWSIYIWGVETPASLDGKAIIAALKTIGFTFGFLTSAGLYISWMNRWFDKHAEVQFQTKQFEIDINRATWAVEAALEWKGVQGEQMPEALLAGITKHLFESHPSESPDYSPLDVLASSLLGSASNIRLNLGANEVSLDRKGINKITKG